MSRRAPLLLLLPAALAVLALPPGAAPDPASAPPLAARLSACTQDAGGRRTAVFTGSMPAGREAGGRLAMRFVLLERTPPARRARRVEAASARWVTSAPGAGGLVHERRVKDLRDPADYRVQVRFRWYDAAGRVVRTAVRRSPACRPGA